MKQKTFFLVSQLLSFRCKNQTCKNVADTTFKYTSCFRNSHCTNTGFMSTDLRFQLLIIMVDSKCLLMQLVILCQNCLNDLQFVLASKPNKLKYIFDFVLPLFYKHCYLSSFHILLTLPLYNISRCLYKFPQFHFFGNLL